MVQTILVRESLKAGMSRDEAIKQAVIECIRLDVLKDFLTEHGSEVHNMLLTGWNWDEAKKVWQEEAREDGRHEGIAIGVEKGVAIGREEGRHEGHAELFALLESGVSLAEAKRRLGL